LISSDQALSGIRVLDISGSVATCYCAKLFADHGAEVTNVELPGGFPTRNLPPFVANTAELENSGFHSYLNANKSSLVLDYRTPAGRSFLLKMATDADVILDAEEPGTIDDLLAGLDQVRKQGSGLVLSSVTWFGQHGSYAEFQGTDAVCHALSGIVKGIGDPQGPPLLPVGYQAQIIGGLTAFIGTMTHVLANELGNLESVTRLDTSILEANICFTEVGTVACYNTGDAVQRWGINRFPPTYPLGIYACKDGWLGVTNLTPSQWLSFCELLDLPEYAAEQRYQLSINRLEDAHMMDPVIAESVRNKSAHDLFHRGQAMKIPLAPVPTMEQLFESEQYVARNAFIPISHPDQQAFSAPATPFRLFKTPAASEGIVRRLGADSESIIAQFETDAETRQQLHLETAP